MSSRPTTSSCAASSVTRRSGRGATSSNEGGHVVSYVDNTGRDRRNSRIFRRRDSAERSSGSSSDSSRAASEKRRWERYLERRRLAEEAWRRTEVDDFDSELEMFSEREVLEERNEERNSDTEEALRENIYDRSTVGSRITSASAMRRIQLVYGLYDDSSEEEDVRVVGCTGGDADETECYERWFTYVGTVRNRPVNADDSWVTRTASTGGTGEENYFLM